MTITINVPAGYLATAVVADKPYTVDPAKMSDAALLHVFEYGFQRIVNDKTGGKNKDAAAKDKAASDMIARLVAAEYKRRKIGKGALDPIVKYVRDVMRELLELKPYTAKKAEYKDLTTTADREAYLDEWFATMPDELAAKVQAAAQEQLDIKVASRNKIAAFTDNFSSELAEGSVLFTPDEVVTPTKKATKRGK